MWQQNIILKEEDGFNYTAIQHRNSNPQVIKEILIIKYKKDNWIELIIDFNSVNLANLFYQELPEMCPVYTKVDFCVGGNPNTHSFGRLDNNEEDCTSKISINLSDRTEWELKKLNEFLISREGNISEVLVTINNRPRQLSRLETKFYNTLLVNLNNENFSACLHIAKQIVTERVNQSIITGIKLNLDANALWGLAMACRDKGLIEEFSQTLDCIQEKFNYYDKAQHELAHFTLNQLLCCSPEDIDSQKILLAKAIHHSANMGESGLEFFETIITSYIASEDYWKIKNQIFPDASANKNSEEKTMDLLASLAIFTKTLKNQNLELSKENTKLLEENKKLLKANQEQESQILTTTNLPEMARPKLKM